MAGKRNRAAGDVRERNGDPARQQVGTVDFTTSNVRGAPFELYVAGAKILGNHGIFINYVYGTSSDGFKIVGVFSTSDDVKAVRVINEESGSLGVA